MIQPYTRGTCSKSLLGIWRRHGDQEGVASTVLRGAGVQKLRLDVGRAWLDVFFFFRPMEKT